MSPILNIDKKHYAKAIASYYKTVDRKHKTFILNDLCAVCGYNRKWAIVKLKGINYPRPKKKRGRKSFYNQPFILDPLKKVWLAAHYPCSKRLKSILPEWISFLDNISPEVKQILLAISPATIDRILKPSQAKLNRRRLCTTKPGSLLKKHILIKNNQWDEARPGFLEADTVAHCGSSLSGQFIYTLDCVDIATGWSEQRAVWGKGEQNILRQIKHIEHSIPFKLLGFDSDNGSEFLNHHLLRHFTERQTNPVQFTRSRPYHKDDNAHIEQKNWTHVRQWLGYDRLDNPKLLPLLNDLYTHEWRLFHNFFLPSVKLILKSRVGSKIVKRHDTPKTPYKRLLESKFIDPDTKNKLTQLFKTLNPFDLKKSIEAKLKKIFLAA